MKTCNPTYEPYLPDAIRRATGTAPTRLIPVPTFPDSIVYEAELPTGSVIFKAVDPEGADPDGMALEAWMCETVRALGVPAPQILAIDTSRSRLPTSYFVMQKASGQPLSTLPLADQRTFLHQIGGYLRQIHTVELPGFGWLDEQKYRQRGIVRGVDPTWRDAVLKDVAASLDYFRQVGALESQFISAIERVVELAEPILSMVSVGQLLHGDLGELHVWVDPERGTVTSVVDFGERCAGDPIWDMIGFDWGGVPLLAEGYELGLPARERFRPTFHLYGILQAVPWARKWHARGGVHTVEWLKTTIREATPVLGLSSTFD